MPSIERAQLDAALRTLAADASLADALRALHQQQLAHDAVLCDPGSSGCETRQLQDQTTGLTLLLQWNPDRELRKDHARLLERGTLRPTHEPLINPDARGIPCYLCAHNIARQNPAEVLFALQLAQAPYYAGANLAPVGRDHFVIMSAEHRPQRYHRRLLVAAVELAERTAGAFRVLFNGRAGASIEAHEHLHATTTLFPVEALPPRPGDAPYRADYDLPLWIAEGADPCAVVDAADGLIRRWEGQDPERHTVNLLVTWRNGHTRIFIFLRDRERLRGTGRRGALASFEVAGLIVLSAATDRAFFETAQVSDLRRLLGSVAPERQLI